jgi:D-amino peptidase
MAEDTNAAIRGALAAGAGEIVVNDSHGDMRNLLPEDLNPAARLITHSFKQVGMMEGLDQSFDAALFIGYHAQAESPRGVFAHTGEYTVRDLKINGRSVGEGGLNTILAEWYGVPVVLVTGDDVAVSQVKGVATKTRGVVVKHAINNRAMMLEPLARVHQWIENEARDGVASSERFLAQRGASYRVEMRFDSTLIPEIAEAFPGITRPSPDTVTFERNSMPAAYRELRVLYRYINPN